MSSNTFHPRLEVFFCITDSETYAEKAIGRMQSNALVTGMTTKSAVGSALTYYICAGVWINQIDPHPVQAGYMQDLAAESQLPSIPFEVDADLKRAMLTNLRWSTNAPCHLINGPRVITPQEVRGVLDFLILLNDNDELQWFQFAVDLIVNGGY